MFGLRPDEDAALSAVRDFSIARLRRARALRRLVMAAVVLFVLAGAANLLGERTSRVTARGGGYELTVTYPTVTRPGQDAGWMLEVRRAGGFAGPVRLAVDASYLDLFDQTTLRPDPSSGVQDAGQTVWTFDPPAGDTLAVRLEAHIGQDAIGTYPGRTEVLGGTGPVVGVDYRSRALP